MLGANQISFHWLKENIEEKIVLKGNMEVEYWVEDDERSSSSELVVQ